MHVALHEALKERGDQSLAHLVQLRIVELLAMGRDPLINGDEVRRHYVIDRAHVSEVLSPDHISANRDFYEKAREITIRRNAKREEFVLARLAEGRHPDNESPQAFWAGYEDRGLPKAPTVSSDYSTEIAVAFLAAGAIAIGAVLALSRFVVKPLYRRRVASR